MVTNQTQTSVLRDRLDSDPDYMHEVQDVLESNPNRQVIFPDNPCNLGFWLVGIQNGNEAKNFHFKNHIVVHAFLSFIAVTRTAVVDLVQDYDMEKGEVLYSTPVEGWCVQFYLILHNFTVFHPFNLRFQLTLWCGVDSSQEDHVALLMCVATSGHHSIASYQWSKDGCDLLGEVHPLLYATKAGKYTCILASNNKSAERLFEVKGGRSSNINNVLHVLIH